MSKEQTYKARMVYDPEGIDIGDWLPQDEDHYNSVGPFSREDINGLMAPCTWEQWWADPEAKAENWVSYGMLLQSVCSECDCVKPAHQSLWGLDDLVWGKYEEGTFTRDELVKMDPYLGEVFDDLVHEAEAEAEAKAA